MATSSKEVKPGDALHQVTKSLNKNELERFRREMERRWLDYLKECERAARRNDGGK